MRNVLPGEPAVEPPRNDPLLLIQYDADNGNVGRLQLALRAAQRFVRNPPRLYHEDDARNHPTGKKEVGGFEYRWSIEQNHVELVLQLLHRPAEHVFK